MKKLLCFLLILTAGIFSVFADDFTDAIQDLAIQTACIGRYSATEAGGGLYDDPVDWYTPQMMAERFANMSGNMTRITTFYGVCFDYAQFAWEDIVQYKDWYNEQGMYERQFWIAGVNSNPNQIELMSPAKQGESSTRKQNGVLVKTYSSSIRNVKTHRLMNKGDRATNHAWLWIERADGVWFWIDPTWTDNLGYVVYGYVSSSGEEIQCRPDRDFCINYPAELNNLPLPPSMGTKTAPSKSANSTDRNETIKDAGTQWMTHMVAMLVSAEAPFSSIINKSINIDQMGFSLELPVLADSFATLVGLEYLHNLKDGNSLYAGLLETDFAKRLLNNVAWFAGFGIGLRFDTSATLLCPGVDSWLKDTWADELWFANMAYFAFKINTGFILNISKIFTKIDISYNNVFGFSVSAGLGWGVNIL